MARPSASSRRPKNSPGDAGSTPTISFALMQMMLLSCVSPAVAAPAANFLSLGGAQVVAVPGGQATPSATVTRMLQDDVSGDFGLTVQSIRFLDEALGQFARRHQIGQEMIAQGRPISQWAQMHGAASDLDAHMVAELDYLLANYEKVKGLIMRVVTEKPQNEGHSELAFRCKRYDELKLLKGLADPSGNFRMLADVFSSELFDHCVRRKLAMIELANSLPSATVRQFVDIYLDSPAKPSGRGHLREQREAIEAANAYLLSGCALNFDLQRAVSRHGNLERASELVFDASMSMSLGGGSSRDASALVARFKLECGQHVSQLAAIWGDLDDVAKFLSSPMVNLTGYSEQMKLVAPQLAYASVCAQLAST